MNGSAPAITEQVIEARLYKFVNEAISKHGASRCKLIPILQEVQREIGFLPRHALELISTRLGVPLSEVLAVVSFYHQFRLEPVGEYVFQVCYGTACYLRGAEEVYQAIKLSSRSSRVDVEKVRCFGCCSLAPVVMVVNAKTGERFIHGRLTPSEARKLVLKYASKKP